MPLYPSQAASNVMKTKRVTTGSVTGAATSLVTITWDTAFADTSYTASVDVLDATTTSLSLTVVHIETQTAAAITVRVLNNAVGALTGTLMATGIHD